jgi:D-arabinose 1-dehydrogenase-like Zn-dependent alcohol dehydrogenase
MATMRVAQLSGAKQKFEIVERPIPQPTPGTVRIKVAACGICHSDALVKEGLWPGLQYPRVPGHEVTGTIDAVGAGVTRWSVGQRVGVGRNGGYCGQCDQCRRGNLFACETGQVTGISFDGGYSGLSIDSEDTLRFSARTGVHSMNETFPFDRVNEAYDRMASGKARFRVALRMGDAK